jgi:hypothetical protein
MSKWKEWLQNAGNDLRQTAQAVVKGMRDDLSATSQAVIRAGAKELAQALPAFPDSVKPVEEPGLPGNLTPQEIFRQKEPEREEYEK